MKNLFDIVRHRKWFYAFSLLIIIPGIISIVLQGFNLGIDFTGGTLLDLKFEQIVRVDDVRNALGAYGLENSGIQISESASQLSAKMEGHEVLIRTADLPDDKRVEVLNGLADKLGKYDLIRVEKVGATIGKELTQKAVLTLIIASIAMVIYITFRFEIKFAIAAIIALLHDVLVVLGLFSLFQWQIDSTFIAAILTILGYSINDTIVIFDRIRENMKLRGRKADIIDLVNDSLWQTMTRSIYTVLTVLFTVVALLIFGGETTKIFALALLIGITSGCYSSICNASQLWVDFNLMTKKNKGHVAAAKAR